MVADVLDGIKKEFLFVYLIYFLDKTSSSMLIGIILQKRKILMTWEKKGGEMPLV